MTYTIDIRQRRQATIPSAVLVQLGVGVGDSLEIEVSGKKAVVTPKKQIALEALAEIQKAFQKSPISEKEMLDSIDKSRQD
jgi:bifunctional DNA-binding transcriptional regulator/antitoxin component of YhaV-PrlF toxin-antitoxin module